MPRFLFPRLHFGHDIRLNLLLRYRFGFSLHGNSRHPFPPTTAVPATPQLHANLNGRTINSRRHDEWTIPRASKAATHGAWTPKSPTASYLPFAHHARLSAWRLANVSLPFQFLSSALVIPLNDPANPKPMLPQLTSFVSADGRGLSSCQGMARKIMDAERKLFSSGTYGTGFLTEMSFCLAPRVLAPLSSVFRPLPGYPV